MPLRSPQVNDELLSQPEVNPGPPDRDKDAPSNLEVNPGPLEQDKPVYFLSEENFPHLGKSGTMGDHKLIPKGRSSLGKNPPPLEKSGAPKLLSFPFKKISFMDPFYKFIL